jgi:uncharacterized protein
MAGAVLLLAASFVRAEAPSLPRPARYVTDRAGILPAERADALNERLAAFERETSDQVLVYTEKRVPEGTTIEELGARAIRDWGPGQKGKSNGLIFFVFPDDRKMRIEVGYGLEGAIPDARAHRITDEVVKPFFLRGDFAGGVEAGVAALLSAARGEPFAGSGKTVAEGRRSPAPLFLLAAFGFVGFWILMAVLIVRASRKAAGVPLGARRGGLTSGSGQWSSSALSSSSDTSSSSSSDSSSSSYFSGGGGDGGGGGSSDSW